MAPAAEKSRIRTNASASVSVSVSASASASTAAAPTNLPQRRRRRKRNRPQNSGGSATANRPAPSVGWWYQEDDDRFAFLDKDGDNLADGRPLFRSLPILLEERRSGIRNSNSNSNSNSYYRRSSSSCCSGGRTRAPELWRWRWRSETLSAFTKKPPGGAHIARRQWRGFAHRTIPFTALGTPTTDAVLAVERNADYLLSLGHHSCDEGGNHTGLALRFYGIHSRAAHAQAQAHAHAHAQAQAHAQQPNPGRHNRHRHSHSHRQQSTRHAGGAANRAPLLQTTPLHPGTKGLPDRGSEQELSIAEDSILDLQGDFSPSTTPVELLVSRDWKLLWSVESIPNQDATGTSCNSEATGAISSLCETCFRAPGYLLFIDEGDGFRLTWATEKCFLVDSCLEDVSMDSRFGGAAVAARSAGVNIISPDSVCWEETHCSVTTGEELGDATPANGKSKPSQAQVSIVKESFLHIDVLLVEILSKRKAISETNPDFCYSLISVNRGGRIADVVIAFARERKASSIGVFVKIDLFLGVFVELDWVQSKGKKNTVLLQKWCNTLATNRRMREMRAGPFSVSVSVEGQKTFAFDCTRLCKETFTFDNDEEDDYDESYWEDFVLEEEEANYSDGKNQNQNQKQKQKQKRRQAPKLVTMSSLYPCCDLITNQAIICFEPVTSIRAKDSPIQLVYS
eukprot:jgi/Psemu1/322819/estExt_fgenesh1_pg.C_430015